MNNLLEVTHLGAWHYQPDRSAYQWTLREIDLYLTPGECLGITGESGSGKTTLGLALVGVDCTWPGVVDGTMRWQGKTIIKRLPELESMNYGDVSMLARSRRLRYWQRMRQQRLAPYRGAQIFWLSQHPRAALTPYFTVAQQLRQYHPAVHVPQVLQQVGLSPSIGALYPHQLSSGMAQRVNLAMGLHAGLIVADEPTSKLDVRSARHLVRLLRQRLSQQQALLVLTHDLELLAALAQRFVILLRGLILEKGPVVLLAQGYQHHPYTRMLLQAQALQYTQMWAPVALQGCPLQTRCPEVLARCRHQLPALTQVAPQHWIRCWQVCSR